MSFDFPQLDNVNQSMVTLQPYPGSIRFMVVCIIESEWFLSFTCNSANFDYISNDFKQKSPNLNNLSESNPEGMNIEPGCLRSEGNFNIIWFGLIDW